MDARYLANALERCFKKFFINHAHRVRFEGYLPFWFKVKRRSRDRRQAAVLADRKGPMLRVDHPERHVTTVRTINFTIGPSYIFIAISMAMIG